MSILHIESFENHGDEGFLAKTDAGDGASTVFLAVDVHAEELACRSEIRDLVFFREPGFDINRRLVVSSGYNIQMSSKIKSIRIPSLRR